MSEQDSRRGVRQEWVAIPAHVRRDIDALVGSPVASATNLAGGFSPGPAARCVLADGRTAFVKAAGSEPNVLSPTMHRREAEVLALLPPEVPAPRLIGVVDDGDWVAVAVEWVDGTMPEAPATAETAARALRLVERLAASGAGDRVGNLQTCVDAHPDLVGHWGRLRDEPLPGLGHWEFEHLDELAALEADFAAASSGDDLLHVDLRLDNMLFAEQEADDVIVDWPGACRGAACVDLVGMLPSLHLDGGPDPEDAFASSSVADGVDPAAVDVVLAAIAGFFVRKSLLPTPPGLPTVRAFQAAQGRIAVDWLRRRLDAPSARSATIG